MFIEQILLGISIINVIFIFILDKLICKIDNKELRNNFKGVTGIMILLNFVMIALGIAKMLKLL